MLHIVDSQVVNTSFSPKDLPGDDIPKIIFMGRSNVGKSTLINKLAGRKKLARTSSKPGKTVSINYYEIKTKGSDDVIHFVDLPGYGYAKISRTEILRVKKLMSAFFRTVKNAKLAVLLLDSRRGLMDVDKEIVAQIVEKKIKLLTVLTKSDKLRNSELVNQKKVLQNRFGLNVVPFTVKSDENKEEMLKLIYHALME